MLLKSRGIFVKLYRLFSYYLIGKFFNLILPTSMGGDIVRIHVLGVYTGRKADAVASVFVERFCGMITLIGISIAAVLVNLKIFNIPIITISLSVFTVIILFIGWIIIDQRPLKIVQKKLGNKVPMLVKYFSKLKNIQKAVLDYKKNRSALLIAVLNSLIFYFLAVVNVWFNALAFDINVNFLSMLVAVPVILLIMNLPISIGGIGLMELAYTLTLELVGYSAALGLSVALLMRAKTFVDAGIGGLLYPFFSEGRSIVKEVTGDS